MMPNPALAPSQALANISRLIRSRARHAGTDAAMSRIVSTRDACRPGNSISWPESGS